MTDEEKKAIRKLELLAKQWPEALMLFSATGTLCVLKSPDGSFSADAIVAIITGIWNDGGDPEWR